MKSGSGRIAVLALTVALSTAALAGMKTGQQVYISDANKFANGEIGFVRNTADSTQYIGCTVNGDLGSCNARDRNGLSRSCSTTVAKWVNTIRAVNGDSYVYFAWDSNGKCTQIIVQNHSTAAPK